MATKAPAIVRGEGGLLGTIVERLAGPSDELDAIADVLLDDGRMLRVPSDLLTLQGDGTYKIAASAEEIARRSEGMEGDSIVVPVMAEVAEVGKRRVETGRVRVRKTVRTADKVIDEPVFSEEFEVERVPVNRMIAEPVGPRQEGDTLIVPLLEEVLVVEKRLMLREEVRITRRRVERRSPQTITLRSEEATVDRIASEVDAEGPIS